jgi:hypothetical protein
MALISRTASLLAIVAALAAPANGQEFARLGGPFSRVPVLNAPFSAEATTRVQEVSPDGHARLHTVTARYYRDSQGRVRAEVDTQWGPYVVVASPGPERLEFHVLDPTKRTYRIAAYGIAAQLFNGESGVAVPVGKVCFQYPSQVAAGLSDADRLGAVNAQVSPDLGIVTASHRADESRSVVANANIRRSLDYEVTNIRREEPPAQLFEVPSDYTFISVVGSGEDPLVGFAPWQSPPACQPLKR